VVETLALPKQPSPLGQSRDAPAPSRPATPATADLLTRLVENVLDELLQAGSLPLTDDGHEILLSAEYCGVRCLLTRPPAAATAGAGNGGRVVLSPRELEIARMVAWGYPNKTIAAVLEISLWTVSTYLRRIFAKLGVSSRAAMVTRLHEEGIRTELIAAADARRACFPHNAPVQERHDR
jgi:DNA-binding CsgD family transcriptional regulator